MKKVICFGSLFLIIISTNLYIVIENLKNKNSVCSINYFLSTLILACISFGFLTKKIFDIKKRNVGVRDRHMSLKKYYFLVAFVLFFLWLPVFLAYYPGIFAYDVFMQLIQTTGRYGTHHPLAHTIYLKFFYNVVGGRVFNNYNLGIACASIVQMIIFSFMMSYIHLYLYRIKVNKTVRIILIGCTALLPMFSMLAISMTKDVFFSGFVGMLVTSLCFYYSNKEQYESKKVYSIIYICSIIGTILFRNNGRYPIIVMLVIFVIFGQMKKNYKMFYYTFIGAILGLVGIFSLKTILNANEGSKNEMLSVPYQQIASVYSENYENLTKTEIKNIEQVMPSVRNYKPYLSDYVKNDGQGMCDVKKFINLYINLGCKYPSSYIKAFFMLNAGYFNLTDTSFSEIYGKKNRQGIFQSMTRSGFNVEHKTKFNVLEKLYEYLYTDNNYQNIWGLNLLCAPAFYFWLIIIFVVACLAYRCSDSILICTYMLVLLATLLAGPCVLPRYALPYIVCIPALFSFVFYKIKENNANNEENKEVSEKNNNG